MLEIRDVLQLAAFIGPIVLSYLDLRFRVTRVEEQLKDIREQLRKPVEERR